MDPFLSAKKLDLAWVQAKFLDEHDCSVVCIRLAIEGNKIQMILDAFMNIQMYPEDKVKLKDC